MNPYLARLRGQYTELRTSIDAIYSSAANHPAETEGGEPGRELTDAELRSVEAMNAEATRLLPQIEALAAIESRNAQVDALTANLRGDQGGGSDGVPGESENLGGEQHRSTSNTTAQDRDPGHYRSESDGGRHSFFRDLVVSREGDVEAAQRLTEHSRALSTGVAGAGIVPPNWLLSEYQALARQGRVVANAVRRIEITNPAPMTLQKQTAGTDSVIAEQATENTHPSETDGFATDVDVVVPKPTSGIQVVSRQMIDMGSPAADLLIYGDMSAVYDRKVEDKVTAALVAAAGGATVTLANEAAFTAVAAEDAITDAAIAVWNGRKLPATVVAMRVSRWGKFNKFRDTTNRKLYPTSDAGPMNVDGVGSVQAAGNVGGLPVLATDGLGIGGATYPENIIVFRASDTILFEGALQRFRFEEVAGPESVKLGIWAYTAVIVRQAASSVRRVQITAA